MTWIRLDGAEVAIFAFELALALALAATGLMLVCFRERQW